MDERLTVPARLALPILALVTTCIACTTPTSTDTPTPTGTEVTVNVVDSQGRAVSASAALRFGDDSWTSVVPEATGTFTFRVPDGETRYGFAVNCPSGLQASSTKVTGFLLTTDEATELRATCPLSFVGAATTVEGSFDATAIAGAHRVRVYSDVAEEVGATATPTGTYGPIAATAGTGKTIVGLVEDASFETIAVRVLRNQSLTSAANVAMTFQAGDAVGTVMSSDFTASVPAGFSGGTFLYFLPENADIVLLHGGASTAPIALPTVSSMQTGDLYILGSNANDGGSPAVQYATIHVAESLAGLDLDLPEPWVTAPSVVGTALPTFGDLDTLPGRPDFRGHSFIYFWDGIHDVGSSPGLIPGAMIQFFVSTGWRGEEPSFALPNLTTVPGFDGARPLSGEPAEYIVGAVASSLDTATLVSAEAFPIGFATGVLTPLYPPRVQGAVNRIGMVQGSFMVP